MNTVFDETFSYPIKKSFIIFKIFKVEEQIINLIMNE